MKFYEILDSLDIEKTKDILMNIYNISEDLSYDMINQSIDNFKNCEINNDLKYYLIFDYDYNEDNKQKYSISLIDENNKIYDINETDDNIIYNMEIDLSEIDEELDNETIFVLIIRNIIKNTPELNKIFNDNNFTVIGKLSDDNILFDNLFDIIFNESISDVEYTEYDDEDIDSFGNTKYKGTIKVNKTINLFNKNKIIFTDIFKKGIYNVYNLFQNNTYYLDILNESIDIENNSYTEAVCHYIKDFDTFKIKDDIYISNLNNLSAFQNNVIEENDDNYYIDIIENSLKIKRSKIKENIKNIGDHIRIIKYRNKDTNKLEGICIYFLIKKDND